MARKRLTQIFPWLLPIRRKQRTLFFYTQMKFDKNRYATKQELSMFPHRLFTSSCPMLNTETGFDRIYQENKVHNLKLAATKLHGLVIEPGETFSFWLCIKGADKDIPYKDALAEVDGRLVTEYGGGLCMISNLLCWLFLHTPLTITERHGHGKKDFPEPPSDAPMGVDATVAEGWLDFKVTNHTDCKVQLSLTFDEDNIIGAIYTERELHKTWKVINKDLIYYRAQGNIYEEVDVVQQVFDDHGFLLSEKTAYRNLCEIGYALPDNITVIEKG